jgi:hypothetical protein
MIPYREAAWLAVAGQASAAGQAVADPVVGQVAVGQVAADQVAAGQAVVGQAAVDPVADPVVADWGAVVTDPAGARERRTRGVVERVGAGASALRPTGGFRPRSLPAPSVGSSS